MQLRSFVASGRAVSAANIAFFDFFHPRSNFEPSPALVQIPKTTRLSKLKLCGA